MSVSCPNCGAAIEQDFGLAHCPSCAQMVSIDVDGQVHLATVQEDAPTDGPPMGLAQDAADFAPEIEYSELNFEAPVLSVDLVESEVAPDSPADQYDSEITMELPSPDTVASGAEAPASKSMQEELAEFANTDTDSSVSLFDYELKISGIDTGNLRAEVLRLLADGQFGWSHEDLQPKIKNGELLLTPVGAAAIVVIVQRLSVLNLQLQWSQKS